MKHIWITQPLWVKEILSMKFHFLWGFHHKIGGGWGCEVSCGGHHRPRGKTTTGSALDGAVFDIAQIRASENIFRLQCKCGSSKWASPHHKQFATFLRNFYIFKQLSGNFKIWASVRRTRRTLFSDALAQILAYLVHNMSKSQLYLGFGHFGWLPSFFGQ